VAKWTLGYTGWLIDLHVAEAGITVDYDFAIYKQHVSPSRQFGIVHGGFILDQSPVLFHAPGARKTVTSPERKTFVFPTLLTIHTINPTGFGITEKDFVV